MGVGGVERLESSGDSKSESRLYTGSIFRPLLDTKTRIGSQGYVLSDGMVSSSLFSYATWSYVCMYGILDLDLQLSPTLLICSLPPLIFRVFSTLFSGDLYPYYRGYH